ncbi:Hsp20 family protein [Caulobacter sp.]|uniref:Hsp20 family protein n=1 Tax=Caulobacter sp. TaxID=78 RepID=UPI002B47ACEB|nr:Hsp20 family protein [Caulobacter sp.]HJV40833.1 Hsp20 family protein [Caulobacter sp.]
MTRTILFDSPFLLGFEHTRDLIERAAKAAAESYPPYNVEQAENGVRITLAVAGFSPEQLHVTVEGGQLVVAGKRDSADGRSEAERAFLHRGIAARGFVRTFVLAEGMEVTAATLEHGLLHIDLARPEPERLIKRIPIRSAG